jgi:hypothetical protein
MLLTTRNNVLAGLHGVCVMVPSMGRGGSGEVHAIVFQGKAAQKTHGFTCRVRGDVPRDFAAGTGHLLSPEQRANVCVKVCGCACIDL